MIKYLEFTAEGGRSLNEDYVLIKEIPNVGLFAAVADGVGGNNRGEVASRSAVESVCQALGEGVDSFQICITNADQELKNMSSSVPEMSGMATTLTCILIQNNTLKGAHVGDTRIYLLRNNGIIQLSEDQTDIVRMMNQGLLTKEQARFHPHNHILYSAIGSNKDLVIQNISLDDLMDGDRILLMSDGAYSAISKRKIRDISKEENEFECFFEKLATLITLTRPVDNFSIAAIEI